MKNLQTLSPKDCLEIYSKLILNSEVLCKTSQKAASSQDYGVATSLMILASEELVKGILLYFKGIGINYSPIKELRNVFYQHKPKHEIGMLMELLRLFEIQMNIEKHNLSKRKGTKFIDKLLNGLNYVHAIIEPIATAGKNLEWWNKADTLKNRGFYVDYNDHVLLPSEIKQETFDEALKILSDLKKRFKIIQLFIQRNKSNEVSQFIDVINQTIKETAKKRTPKPLSN